LFTKDDPGVSHCGPTCRETWHRVKTDGKPVAGSGISQSHLGQTNKHQVTYYGHPLYYYANDYAAGTDYGQCLPQGAAFWYILHASGSPNTSCV
jgi:predicted lipoprotein with Yx(FWY)xxD motif